ncbi:hypothetical protein H0E87_023389 [Populus deltoides]|uniref:Uncharacterized protein n=1 Tax=Populus deltoides TaxID=3696 RepID=A0A8T2XEZ1_POPDE|nr:hypothetical protein H0E87_023389 [Populus deltoides]
MMNHEYCLVMDAWIREAQEATKLVEDIESRIKNKDLAEENRLRDIAQSKLIEAGVKLDRLESLLHNPPSKPALTKEDSEFRWKMISDLQLRTRALALRLYTSTKRAGGFLVSTTTGTSRTTNSLDQDQKRKLHSKFDPELLTLLTSEDTTQDQVQPGKTGCEFEMDHALKQKRVDHARWGVVVVEGIGVFQQHLSVDLSTKKYSAVCISSQKPAPTSLRNSPGDEHFDQTIEET